MEQPEREKGRKNSAKTHIMNRVSFSMCSYSDKGNLCRVEEWNDAISSVQGQCTIAVDGDEIQNGAQSGKFFSLIALEG